MKIQNDFAEKIEKSNEIEYQMEDYTEIVEVISESVCLEVLLPLKLTRGAVNLDCEVNGKERVITDTIYLEKGDKVALSIWGDTAEDRFKAGILDANETARFVSSKNGEINHTFTISSSGEYSVFVEGISDKVIHVTGVVYIK